MGRSPWPRAPRVRHPAGYRWMGLVIPPNAERSIAGGRCGGRWPVGRLDVDTIVRRFSAAPPTLRGDPGASVWSSGSEGRPPGDDRVRSVPDGLWRRYEGVRTDIGGGSSPG